MQKIIWLFISILLIIGFIPFKSIRNPKSIKSDELQVEQLDATCSADLSIIQGHVGIPENLSKHFKKSIYELSISNKNHFLNKIQYNQPNEELRHLTYIVSGTIIGVDSIDKKYCGNFGLYEVSKWNPTSYKANIWTFNRFIFISYFIILIILFLLSCILAIRQLNN